jgi:uncharacterized membrane protein
MSNLIQNSAEDNKPSAGQSKTTKPAPQTPIVPNLPVPWEALLAIVVLSVLYTVLPERLTVGPSWLVGAIVLILLSGIIMARASGNHRFNHQLALFTYSLITLAVIVSVVLLITTLSQKDKIAGSTLLRDSVLLWVSNVLIFALWYWQLDAGGPYKRHHNPHFHYKAQAELLFPQLMDDCPGKATGEEWKPQFVDYLFVAFNTSTAFSPTDTAVISRRLKLMSMLQSSISVVVVVTLAGRAVNIL